MQRNTEFNAAFSLLQCVEQTTRMLLIELADTEAAMVRRSDAGVTSGASDIFDTVSAELEALRTMTDLDDQQWGAVCAAAWTVAELR